MPTRVEREGPEYDLFGSREVRAVRFSYSATEIDSLGERRGSEGGIRRVSRREHQRREARVASGATQGRGDADGLATRMALACTRIDPRRLGSMLE